MEFNDQLKHLVDALDPQEGWYAVFLQRDGDALRSCIDGNALPTWDVVTALLDDLHHKRGIDETVRSRALALHSAAAAAHDHRVGRTTISRILHQTVLERDAAAAQLRGLYESHTGRETQPHSPADLFQARDRYERAAAGCAELEVRLARLDAEPIEVPPAPVASPARPTGRRNVRFASATFAALAFGGMQAPTQATEGEPVTEVPGSDPAAAAEVRRLARQTGQRLAQLRAQGHGGQAHIALLDALAGSHEHTVALIEELEAAGQTAEVPTLLWEAACLRPDQVTALVGALCDANREADAEVLLRNGASQPAEHVASVVRGLLHANRIRELDVLLGPLFRARPPQQAVRMARDDASLVSVLIDSAGRVSEQCQRELAYALRTAGLRAPLP